MLDFKSLYYNRNHFTDYIDNHIIYLLSLSNSINNHCFGERFFYSKNNESNILSFSAMEELRKEEILNFFYIITDNSFNDAAIKSLFKLFFETDIYNNSFIDEYFKELLSENFFNFSHIFKQEDSLESFSYLNKNKKRKSILINHFILNNLFFSCIKKYIKDLDNDYMKLYIEKCNQIEKISNLLYEERQGIELYNPDYFKGDVLLLDIYNSIMNLYNKFELELKNNEQLLTKIKENNQYYLKKSEFLLRIIGLVFLFDYKNIIGDKQQIERTKNYINILPSIPFYINNKFPLFFNNPFLFLEDCVFSLDDAMEINLSINDKIDIIQLVKNIHNQIFNS